MIIGGGKGEEIKFFEKDEAEEPNYTSIGKQTGFKDSILCCAYANTNTDFVVGTADGTIKIFSK